MIKRKGQQQDGVAPPSLKRMSDTEYAAYFEAFGAIEADYQALCLISDKLREVETTAHGLGSLDSQAQGGHAELPDSAGGRSPWDVCAPLMRLNHSEVLLCKRVCEHGLEYAVIDHSPVASAYAKTRGPLDVLHTGDSPHQVLRDYPRVVSTATVAFTTEKRNPPQLVGIAGDEIGGGCQNRTDA